MTWQPGEIYRAWDEINHSPVYDHASKRLQLLPDEEAAILINRDPLIRTAWRKWNAASNNKGSLLVLDAEHARRVLRAANDEPEEDDEMKGLA